MVSVNAEEAGLLDRYISYTREVLADAERELKDAIAFLGNASMRRERAMLEVERLKRALDAATGEDQTVKGVTMQDIEGRDRY